MSKEILLQKMKEAKDRIISKMIPGQVGYIRVSSIAVKGDDFFLNGNEDYDTKKSGAYDIKITRTDKEFRLFLNTLDENDIDHLSKHAGQEPGDLPVEIV